MYGICGILHLNHEPVADDLLRNLTAVLEHRGADADGFFREGGLGLGCRRRSIIDLAARRYRLSHGNHLPPGAHGRDQG